MLNAAHHILRNADALGDRPAMLYHPAGGGAIAVGHHEILGMVNNAAALLTARGLARGERVAILMNDSPRFAAAFLGVVRAGGIAIPLNTRLAPADYAYILADSGARFAIVDAALRDRLDPGTAVQILEGAQFSGQRATADAPAPTEAGDAAFWLYSSGTTGRPKGIIHSHANCAQTGKMLREYFNAGPGFRVFSARKYSSRFRSTRRCSVRSRSVRPRS